MLTTKKCQQISGPANSPAAAIAGEHDLDEVSADQWPGEFAGMEASRTRANDAEVSADQWPGEFAGQMARAGLSQLPECQQISGPANSPARAPIESAFVATGVSRSVARRIRRRRDTGSASERNTCQQISGPANSPAAATGNLTQLATRCQQISGPANSPASPPRNGGRPTTSVSRSVARRIRRRRKGNTIPALVGVSADQWPGEFAGE